MLLNYFNHFSSYGSLVLYDVQRCLKVAVLHILYQIETYINLTHNEELVPTSVLKDRALAIAIELRHPAYDCFYLALAERSSSSLVTADERLIRRCADTPFEKLVSRFEWESHFQSGTLRYY